VGDHAGSSPAFGTIFFFSINDLKLLFKLDIHKHKNFIHLEVIQTGRSCNSHRSRVTEFKVHRQFSRACLKPLKIFYPNSIPQQRMPFAQSIQYTKTDRFLRLDKTSSGTQHRVKCNTSQLRSVLNAVWVGSAVLYISGQTMQTSREVICVTGYYCIHRLNDTFRKLQLHQEYNRNKTPSEQPENEDSASNKLKSRAKQIVTKS
jgi:hypothetical protein